ncbi:MAG: PIN domain-containing protein, partial [bacterium]
MAIDTNIILSIFLDDEFSSIAIKLLSENREHDYLINEIIYLELLTFFKNEAALDNKLKILEVTKSSAGISNRMILVQAWKDYLKKR